MYFFIRCNIFEGSGVLLRDSILPFPTLYYLEFFFSFSHCNLTKFLLNISVKQLVKPSKLTWFFNFPVVFSSFFKGNKKQKTLISVGLLHTASSCRNQKIISIILQRKQESGVRQLPPSSRVPDQHRTSGSVQIPPPVFHI